METMRDRLVAATFVSAVVMLPACTSAPPIKVADDLVAYLRSEGVSIETLEPAPKPEGNYFRFDEGVRAKGPELFLDILRIEDRRVFDIAKSAGKLLVVAEAVAGQPIPDNPIVFARHPFVVVIREEPAGANLEATLAKLLPPERE
ncbi:MAG: hypothetical protein HUU46_21685 [Candidatus Hydrogenedentes bacterium]|nr:hypothetical protein [Candidatus Hydrogenedentota bacterium]